MLTPHTDGVDLFASAKFQIAVVAAGGSKNCQHGDAMQASNDTLVWQGQTMHDRYWQKVGETYQSLHRRSSILALSHSSFPEGMQPLQQLLAVHMHPGLALHQVASRQILPQLVHSPAGQELKGADVGAFLILKQAEKLLNLTR